MTSFLQPIFLEVAVLVLGLLLVLFESFSKDKDKRVIAWSAISGLGLVFVASFFTASGQAPELTLTGFWSFYTDDALAMFFKRFALLATILVSIMSLEYATTLVQKTSAGKGTGALGEFYALPVLTCAGLMWMASAVDFIMVFVSLELVTISFYILVGFMRQNLGSLEAGVKFLILGALSTGFLVFGITWVFGMTGQTNFAAISLVLSSGSVPTQPLLFGLVLILVGLGFKVAAVPFQIWVPDVYQGAPTPITAFLSVASKAAGFVILLRVIDMLAVEPAVQSTMLILVTGIAALTLVYGNLASLPQNNLKRLLAYSSIAHAGYLLVAVACVDGPALAFYLAGYLLMTMLAFIVMIVVSEKVGGDDLADFRGLSSRSPLLALGMLVSMLSLAGLPFTIGFFGKFFIFSAAIQQEQWLLVIIGAIAVATGFYYYLKVVRTMYWQPADELQKINVGLLTKITILILIAAIFFFGIYPQPILDQLPG